MVTICAVGMNSDYSLFSGASSVQSEDMNCVFDCEMEALAKKKAAGHSNSSKPVVITTPGEAAKRAELSEGFVKDVTEFEGFSSVPYPDCGQMAIGFGHKITEAQAKYYKKHPIPKEEAYRFLVKDLKVAREEVKSLLGEYTVEKDKKDQDVALAKANGKKLILTKNQEEALIDLVFNLGKGQVTSETKLIKAIKRTKNSHKNIRDANFLEAVKQLDFLATDGGDTPVAGLAKRRLYDVLLFANGWHNDDTIWIMRDFKKRGLEDPEIENRGYFERAANAMIEKAKTSMKTGKPVKLNFVEDFR